MYKIIDLQDIGTMEDKVFDTLEEVRKALASYHSVDWSGESDIDTVELAELCDYGSWDIVNGRGVSIFEKVEYYYIDFKDCEIYSWVNEENEIDNANILLGNKFNTFIEAKEFLVRLLDKQSIS